VSLFGFEALRLSIWGAWRASGQSALYGVCVNSVPLDVARERTGDVPDGVLWRDATDPIPSFLEAYLDRAMAEGVGWNPRALGALESRALREGRRAARRLTGGAPRGG
jgi:hypothetical protein